MKKLNEWFNIKTGIRHWYRVKFTYKDKRGVRLWDVTMNRSLSGKRYIADHRMLSRSVNLYQIAKQNNLPLCNGALESDPQCYLGYFRK